MSFIFQKMYDAISSQYKIYKAKRAKRKFFIKQLNKYQIDIEQFYKLQRIFFNENDLNNSDNNYDSELSEHTFNKIEEVSKIGFNVNHENQWPAMEHLIKLKKYKKVIPIT